MMLYPAVPEVPELVMSTILSRAARSIDDGAARAALDKMVEITNSGASGTVSNSIITSTALDDVDAS